MSNLWAVCKRMPSLVVLVIQLLNLVLLLITKSEICTYINWICIIANLVICVWLWIKAWRRKHVKNIIE